MAVTVSTGALVRVLVAAVAVECAIALVARSAAAMAILSGTGRPSDLVAVTGLLWVAVLAIVALLVSRRLVTQGRYLAAAEAPRQRLDAITDRTEAVLAAPTSMQAALQPIVDLTSGRWVAAEALARFPDDGPPERWFGDAHEAGVGLRLECLAFETACQVLTQLPPGVRLSVNASPALLLDPSFHDLLARLGPDRARLLVEVTEHAAVTEYEEIRAALAPHRALGLRLAVDDTGAGYASFAHVLRLRPEVIKLDRSLLADIDADAARRAFVTAIVLMALELGASVTAEGVETEAELETLRSLGVDAVQGYLLAEPSTRPDVWDSWAARDWLARSVDVTGSARLTV